MSKRYSKFSSILVLIGFFVPITILSIWGVPSWGAYLLVILLSIGIYGIGVILGIVAFAKREKGKLKYVSIISVIFVLIFAGLLN